MEEEEEEIKMDQSIKKKDATVKKKRLKKGERGKEWVAAATDDEGFHIIIRVMLCSCGPYSFIGSRKNKKEGGCCCSALTDAI